MRKKIIMHKYFHVTETVKSIVLYHFYVHDSNPFSYNHGPITIKERVFNEILLKRANVTLQDAR